MRIFVASLFTLLILIAGCGTESRPTTAVEHDLTTDGAAPPAATRSAATENEPTFPEGTGKDKCAVLTLADVSAATGVPAGVIQQRAISGCLYSWESGNGWQDGSVMITSVRVHPSLERAKRSYAGSVRDVAASEVAPAKKQVQDELAASSTDTRSPDPGGVAGSALVDMMPERDFVHRQLTGVGSEAALEGRTVNMRYGNLTIRYGLRIGESDAVDPDVAAELGRRIVANLSRG